MTDDQADASIRAMQLGLDAVYEALSGGRSIAEHRTKPTCSDAWRKISDLGRVEPDNSEKLSLLEAFIEQRGLVADLLDWLPDELEAAGYDMDEYRRELAD